jgi:hypothetical protein
MIVCSNRGPVIACSLGAWLTDHVLARFGACSWRLRSPASGSSFSGASQALTESLGTALVAETFGLGARGVGSLACSKFSENRGTVAE